MNRKNFWRRGGEAGRKGGRVENRPTVITKSCKIFDAALLVSEIAYIKREYEVLYDLVGKNKKFTSKEKLLIF